MVNCPECKSQRLFYVQRIYERHSMLTLPDEQGWCDYDALERSDVDEGFTPYLECQNCNKKFDLKLKEKNEIYNVYFSFSVWVQ